MMHHLDRKSIGTQQIGKHKTNGLTDTYRAPRLSANSSYARFSSTVEMLQDRALGFRVMKGSSLHPTRIKGKR